MFLARSLNLTSQLIILPPDHLLVSVLEFVFSRKNMDAIFNQMVLDFREEYEQLIQGGRNRKAALRFITFVLDVLITSLLVMRENIRKSGKI